MPVYEYACDGCGTEWEAYRQVEDRDNETCESCNRKATRLMSTPGRPVVYGYFSENLDSYITGPKQKQEVMKKKGVTEMPLRTREI